MDKETIEFLESHAAVGLAIGIKLQALMSIIGITQDELASKTGYSQGRISYFCRNEATIDDFSPRSMVLISFALDIPGDLIFGSVYNRDTKRTDKEPTA